MAKWQSLDNFVTLRLCPHVKLNNHSMLPKPKHLGPEYAAQFSDESVAAAYQYRPPYLDEVFDILLNLINREPRTVLDVGCGTGNIARVLVSRVASVDAVDISKPMLTRGKQLPGGDHPHLHWLCGRVETIPLSPPYALITAGASLHWLDWAVVLPRFQQLLAPGAYLAIINNHFEPNPWDAPLQAIINRHSTNRDYQPYNLVAELENRGLFANQGEQRTATALFDQSVAAYIESFHARNGFSRDRMSHDAAASFEREVTALMHYYCPDGRVPVVYSGEVIWGFPLVPKSI